jgi:hypothetical protein
LREDQGDLEGVETVVDPESSGIAGREISRTSNTESARVRSCLVARFGGIVAADVPLGMMVLLWRRIVFVPARTTGMRRNYLNEEHPSD